MTNEFFSLSKCRSGVYDRNIERKVGVSSRIEDMEGINDSNMISNKGDAEYSSTEHNNIDSNDDVDYIPSYNYGGGSLGDNNNHDIEHNKTNNNNNVRCNPHNNNCGCSVRDVNKYDRLYYHCGDASSIEHNNIMNDNNIHYSPLSLCNNDGSSLKYSDDNMRLTNTKHNNIISNNSGDFDPLYDDDDGCLGSLCDNEDRLVACREFDCRKLIICFASYNDTTFNAVCDVVDGCLGSLYNDQDYSVAC